MSAQILAYPLTLGLGLCAVLYCIYMVLMLQWIESLCSHIALTMEELLYTTSSSVLIALSTEVAQNIFYYVINE